MSRRMVLYLVLAFVVAAVCVRLGIWQLSRLRGRRAHNAVVATRLAEPPEPLRGVPVDTGAAHYRRVRVEGRPEYGREVVLVNRTRQGSPGVNILTPVRVAGTDTLVLVNRGWVYSPNASDVDLSRWREGDSLSADGWVEIPTRLRGAAALASSPRAFRWLDGGAVARAVGAPVTPYYVVLDSVDPIAVANRPARLPRPALDEGPHKGYAIQWFCFAAIAIVGGVVFVRKQS